MRVKLLAIPALEPEKGEEELNRFLAGKRVVTLEPRLTGEPSGAYWAICVTYLEPGERASQIRKTKIDYREVLPPEEFAVFVRLRSLRKKLALEEGVPPYALFTNEQLATMIRQQARSLDDLAAIPGVGKARLEKYGGAFLEILRESPAAPEDSRGKPDA